MYKILTVVVLLFSVGVVSAFSDTELIASFSTKNIVRSKLWYEGIQQEVEAPGHSKPAELQLPEEISVALEKL